MLLYSDSSSEFTRLRALGEKDPRLAEYTRALVTLHDENADLAERHALARGMLERLVEEYRDDAIGMASLYYLARIAQVHPVEEDLQKAKLLYLELFENHSDRFFGQLAFLKYAMIEIYDDSVTGSTAATRIRAIEDHEDRITLRDMKRNYHRILGEAYAALEIDDGKAYEHLKAAYEIGIPLVSLRVDVLSKLAPLAEQFGEMETALQAYDELAGIASQDQRQEGFREKANQLRRQLNREAATN